jgi:hypothetical protein
MLVQDWHFIFVFTLGYALLISETLKDMGRVIKMYLSISFRRRSEYSAKSSQCGVVK